MLLAIGASWAPYLGLWSYWRYLLHNSPAAEQSEVSGPITFFLPLLLATAVLLNILLLAILAWTRPRRAPQKP